MLVTALCDAVTAMLLAMLPSVAGVLGVVISAIVGMRLLRRFMLSAVHTGTSGSSDYHERFGTEKGRGYYRTY